MLDAEFYSSLGINYEHAYSHNTGLLAFTQTALTHLPPNAHVLDAGCGTGKPIAISLAAAGHRVTGIDMSEAMVELSRQAVPSGTFEVADMRDYAPKERPDAVFNILSLFALSREEMEKMAARWAQWLNVNGLLYICTMAAEDCDPEGKGKGYDADGKCARDIGFRFMGEQTAITLFTREGWKALLEGENGFEIIDTRTELFVPPEEAQSDEERQYFILAKKK